MEEFIKLSETERESNKKKSKVKSLIDINLDGDTCLDAF